MFEREKLSGNNFNEWFRQLKLVLRVEKKMFVIEQPIPPAPAADFATNVLAEWNAIYDAYNEVAYLMLGSMTLELHRQFENYSPYEMLQELKSMFEKQAGVERFDLFQTFHACKQEEGKSVAAYILQMKGYVDQLECLGYVLPQDLTVGLILNRLTKYFAGFVRNYNMHNMGKTIGELHAMIIEYEMGLPKKAETPQVMMIKGGKIQKSKKKSLKAKGKGKANGKGNDKQVYIPKPKNPKPSAKEHPAKDDTCHHCKEVGHWKRNFPVYLAELLKKKKQVGIASSSDDESFDQCVSCLSGKMTRKSFPHRPERATDLLRIIHTDVCGPLRHVSRQGASYFITFTDDYSRYGYVYLLKHKHELSPPYTPQHNGVSERRNCTSLDMVRSMMNLTTLALSFWDYALESTTRILNMVPTKKALVKRDTPNKLQQISVKCIFIGYPKQTMGYYFYFPPKNKIVVVRYAKFFEKNLITQEVSGRAIDLEEIQDENTSPSEITSEILLEVEGFEPPQEEEIMIRRSERTPQAPYHLCLNVDAEEHSLGDLNEPTIHDASGSNVTFLVLYVDDIIIIGNHIPSLQSIKDYLGKCFAMKDLGEATFIIGIKIYRDKSKRWIGLGQNAYMDKILKRYKMDNSKRGHIPMRERLDLNKTQGASTPKEVKHMQNVPYASAVGSIMYDVRYTRPDIAFANTKDMFLVYGGNPEAELRVDCYCDAGFETDRDDTKSQTGYVFILNGGAVDWKSSKQSTTAMSATEAEYIAASEAVMKAVWIRKFILGLGARHYHRRYHYVRESIALGEIRFLKVHTDDNLADPFTKALSKGKLTQHARSMGLRLASSFM
ncbi:retrotransposon protein, putative, ty1-copia subclass [Tanacetum coccineum]